MKQRGVIKDGMLPKAKAIEEAIRGGVRRVQVISYNAPDSILTEVFTNEGMGTLIVDDNRTDILRLLLDLGLPVDLATHNGQRALHAAAGSGALDAIKLLIDAGADIDRRGGDYKATPLGHGVFWKRQEVIDLIAPLSRDPHDLTWGAQLDRLRVVLDEQPGLANAVNPNGHTPLLSLPDDDEAAAEAVEILLAHGADPNFRNPEGNLPDKVALKRGLDEAAELIRAARGHSPEHVKYPA